MRNIIFVFILSGLSVCVAAQPTQLAPIEQTMSIEQFQRAGLNKLSPAELAALNEWLRNQCPHCDRSNSMPSTASPTPTVTTPANASAAAITAPPEPIDTRGLENINRRSKEPIVSRILGEFRGWSSRGARFELENGQVWRSVDASSTLSVRLTDPTVKIRPGIASSWLLKVEGYNSSVRVKREK